MRKIIKTKRVYTVGWWPILLSFLFVNPSLLALSASILSAPSAYPTHCEESSIWRDVKDGNYPGALETIDGWIESESEMSVVSFLLKERVKILYANQQHTESLASFVSLIEGLNVVNQVPSEHEQAVFDSLFPLYDGALSSYEQCINFTTESEELFSRNPSYYSLELYVCAGLANSGRFYEFFDKFFHAYQFRCDSYLTWKILGVLHIRLYESSPHEVDRIHHREKATYALKKAFERKGADGSLLVKMVFITPKEKRSILFEEVEAHLEALENPLRRNECFYLIEQALQVESLGFAKRCIAKARSWYSYSRALHEFAQQLETLESSL